MPVAVEHFSEISQEQYDRAFATVAQIVGEAHPDLDLRRGVIHDVVLTLHGVLTASLRVERERMLKANSLLAVTRDPTLSDAETLDRLFSNYRISRRDGQQAVGSVTLILSKPTTTVIPQGFVFSAGSRKFATESSFAARLSEADVLSDTDRVLVAQADGSFSFGIDVIAVDVGELGMLRQGETVTPVKSVLHLVKGYASADFSGGQDAELTAGMLQRLELGLSARSWSNRSGIASLVRDEKEFADAEVSVIGAGDAEMLRDKHSAFPISHGNRVDLYVKQRRPPAIATASLAAVFIGNTANGPQWSVNLGRNDLPGVYAVVSLLRTGRDAFSSVAPSSFVRSYNSAVGDPDIINAIESSFSVYQSGVVTFVDAANAGETLTPGVSTATYSVTGLLLRNLAAIQASLNARGVSALAGDVVVRGAVPCFVSVELELKADAVLTIDSARIASVVATMVNRDGFSGAVYASRISAAVSPYLPAGAELLRVRLSGIVFRPDGSKTLFRDREVLAAPNEPAKMTTSKTVAFFLDPSDVSVNIISNG